MAEWRVTVPRWHPTPLNKLLKMHHMAAHRAKKGDMQMVAVYGRHVPKAVGKRRVRLILRLKKGQRGVDPDAPLKVALDALVAAGLLTDDNRQGVELAPVHYERGTETDWGTVIVLEDLG